MTPTALIPRLQQMDGAFHPQALKVRQRRLPQHRVHAARKRPLAGGDRFRRFVQGEPVRQPGASPSFEALHQGIVVNQMIGQHIGGPRFAIFDAFGDEAARQRHLNGPIAQALMAQASVLFTMPPAIEPLEVLGAKLPA